MSPDLAMSASNPTQRSPRGDGRPGSTASSPGGRIMALQALEDIVGGGVWNDGCGTGQIEGRLLAFIEQRALFILPDCVQLVVRNTPTGSALDVMRLTELTPRGR